MENYIDEITTLEEFKKQCPELAEMAERAKRCLVGKYLQADEDDFIVIEVEGYNCVAVIVDNCIPYTIGETIAPFDKDKIYPLQGLVTEFAFQSW